MIVLALYHVLLSCCPFVLQNAVVPAVRERKDRLDAFTQLVQQKPTLTKHGQKGLCLPLFDRCAFTNR